MKIKEIDQSVDGDLEKGDNDDEEEDDEIRVKDIQL